MRWVPYGFDRDHRQVQTTRAYRAARASSVLDCPRVVAPTHTVLARWLAIGAAGLVLATTLLAAVMGHRISRRLRDPTELAAAIANPAVLDHVYEVVLPAAFADRFGAGLVGVGDDATIPLPPHAPSVARDLVERVWPRDVVRAQIDAALVTWAPQIATGRTLSPVPCGPTPRGWAELPHGVGSAFDALALGDTLVEEIVSPRIHGRTDDVLGPVLGVSLSPSESRDAAHRILPSEWIRAQLVGVTRTATPYFAGTVSEFTAVIELRSRVPIAAQVLHDRIVEEQVAHRLVLDRLLDPLVEARLRGAGTLPLGIQVSATEIETAVLASVPPGWFARKTWLLLQVLADYIVGQRDRITFTIPLGERNASFGRQLFELVESKLGQRLAELPRCGRAEIASAIRKLRKAELPMCLPGGAAWIMGLAGPRIEAEIGRTVGALPAELSFDHDDVAWRLGPTRMASIDALRQRVRAGIVWTDRDLAERLDGVIAGYDGDAVLMAMRRGTVTIPDVDDIVARADGWVRWALEATRIAVRHTWLLFGVALLLVVAIARLAPGRIAVRLRSAGYVVSASALVAVAVLLSVSWPAPSDLVVVPAFDAEQWPRLSASLRESPILRAVADLTREFRRSAALLLAPLVFVGPTVHVVAAARGACARRAGTAELQSAARTGRSDT